MPTDDRLPAPGPTPQRTVTVLGSGRAGGTPDLLRITFTVEARRPDVGSAWAQAGRSARAVVDSLQRNGIAAADRATSALTVQTETVWEERRGNRITGYLATSSLEVVLRDLRADADPSPARVVADAVAAGGDDVRLGGFVLGFADPEGLLVRARDAAWANALAKAEQYAAFTGRGLGDVLEVTEQPGTRSPQPVPRTMALAATPSMPIEHGESEITAEVQVTWTLA